MTTPHPLAAWVLMGHTDDLRRQPDSDLASYRRDRTRRARRRRAPRGN